MISAVSATKFVYCLAFFCASASMLSAQTVTSYTFSGHFEGARITGTFTIDDSTIRLGANSCSDNAAFHRIYGPQSRMSATLTDSPHFAPVTTIETGLVAISAICDGIPEILIRNEHPDTDEEEALVNGLLEIFHFRMNFEPIPHSPPLIPNPLPPLASFQGTFGIYSPRFGSVAPAISGVIDCLEPSGSLTPCTTETDLDGDGVTNCTDLAIIRVSFGKRTGQSGFDLRADLNKDGVIDIRDLSVVARAVSVGTSCS